MPAKTNWCDAPTTICSDKFFANSLQMLLSVRIFFLLPPHPLGRRCQGIPMVGTKGFSGPPGKPCRWQTITSQITAQLALPLPRRYPRPSAPPWPAGYLWVPRVPMGIPGLQHCGLLGTTAISPESPWSPWLWSSWSPPPPHSTQTTTEHHIVFAAQASHSTLHNYLSLTCFSLTFSHRAVHF